MRLNQKVFIGAGLAMGLAGIYAFAQTMPGTGASSTSAATPGDEAVTTMRLFGRITPVDVTVMDTHGVPVHGLKQSDFLIEEDGKPQTIRSFEETSAADVPIARVPPKLPPHVYTNVQPPQTTSAVNILLLDSLNTDKMDQSFVKQEAVKFLKTMPLGTRIAVLGLSNRLRILQGFTSDPAILLAAINSKKNRSMPSPFIDTDTGDAIASQLDMADADTAVGLQEFQNEQDSFQKDMRTRMTLEALNQIAAYLAGVKGRKNLIWFTSGMPLQMYPQGGVLDLASMTDYSKDVRKTTDLLTEARIAVYPVDARGLFTNPANSVTNAGTGFSSGKGNSMALSNQAFLQDTASGQLGMEAVAEATGGVAYYNTNGLKEAVGKAVENGSNYYTITYVPPSTKYEGQFHSISIKLQHAGWHLAYRKGYYSDDIAHNAMTPELTLATTAPEPYGNNMAASMGRGVPMSTQLMFDVRIEPHTDIVNPVDTPILGDLDPKLKGKPLKRYDFQYIFPARQITFNAAPTGIRNASVEFDLAVYDVYGTKISSLSQTVSPTLKPDAYLKLQKAPFQFFQQLDLPAGEMFVRVGILDGISDKVGTVEIPITVTKKSAEPKPADPTATTPNTLAPKAAEQATGSGK